VIGEVNTFLIGFSSMNSRYYLKPVKGNIAFMAAGSGRSSALDSFARPYINIYGSIVDPERLAQQF
jgi:hypothetical protein